MFQIGDIVERCGFNNITIDQFFSNGSRYGKVVGFSHHRDDPWIWIEGEYYYRGGKQYVNYYNPKFLKKSNLEFNKKSIKPFIFN